MRRSDGEKGGLHKLVIGVILFFVVFLFAIYIASNSHEANKAIEDLEARRQITVDSRGLIVPGESLVNSPGGVDSEKRIRVVIDPGHGGNDPGKVSADGVLEKDLNLQIAFKLKERLDSLGIESILLRTEDCNLATEGATNKKNSDMKNRVAKINEVEPDILISIHQNSFSDPEVRGPQVFYYDASRKSEEYALLLQEKLNAINPECARKAKCDNELYILSKSICPAVIVECGFLSSPEDVAILTSDSYQYELADSIAACVKEWLEP